jgi:hypothetical protein
VTPIETAGQSGAGQPAGADQPDPRNKWYHKLGSLLFAIFCFEMGLFLLLFPWVDAWSWNYFGYFTAANYREASLAETWRGIWLSPYFRGAVSGLGVVNIYIALQEVFRLRRFTAPRSSAADLAPQQPRQIE